MKKNKLNIKQLLASLIITCFGFFASEKITDSSVKIQHEKKYKKEKEYYPDQTEKSFYAKITAFFSPDQNIKNALIQCIENEFTSIAVASFRLTDKDIAAALVNAYLRGVKIELVVDRGCLGMAHSKILAMAQQGMAIYVFPPLDNVAQNISSNALMHNKFMIFYGQNAVWTGSYNFTQAAQSMHQENALLIYGKEGVKIYHERFAIIKNRSSFVALKNNFRQKRKNQE